MDSTAENIIDREQALADFDHARDDFENALSMVPAEALDYKPEGDEFTFADFVPHITNALVNYSNVLDQMREAQYHEVVKVAAPDHDALLERHRRARAERPQEQHRTALDEMEAAHDRLAGKLREMAYEEYGRATPVIFSEGAEVLPTRASDIIGWVRDHYREHAEQTVKMLREQGTS